MPGGYGLYAGKGWSTCARPSADPVRGTLRIPSTVAKAVLASVEVCRRTVFPPRLRGSCRFQAPTVTAARLSRKPRRRFVSPRNPYDDSYGQYFVVSHSREPRENRI